MELRKESFEIARLIKTWRSGSLTRNEEYQRGAKWKEPQRQALVDSVFREYPIPPLFLHEIRDEGLSGEVVKRYEIVDGQQRILALDGYLSGKYPLLQASDRRLRLPNSLRRLPALWGGKRFEELPPEFRQRLESARVDVFIITEVASADEVRDLFIRLQSGTALTRQEIRDAWPGAVGPYVEKLAGKLDRRPTVALFRLVDKRGTRPEDERDQHEPDRQLCAQLLCLFLARERDPGAEQSIGANELDKVYHDNTEFPVEGPTAHRFEAVLGHATQVLHHAIANAAVGKALKGSRFRGKFKKLDIIATVLLVQDLTRSPGVKLDQAFYGKLAEYVCTSNEIAAGGKSTSGPAIAKYYREWRSKLPDLGIRLDPKRCFDERQKAEMHRRQNGCCAVCSEPLSLDEAEGDHYPQTHSDGGPTTVDNGRLVHRKGCHPRGRPPSDDDVDL